MGEQTGISWCDSTFNHVRGCTKVSPGCTHCYADRDSNRNPKVLGVWGPRGTRVLASEDMWAKPLKWDAAAASTGRRHLVFCASLADVFEQWDGPIVNSKGRPLAVSRVIGPPDGWAFLHEDHQVGSERVGIMDDVRLRLFDLIRKTPSLTWLLLTKRIEDVMGTLARCSKLCNGRQVNDGLQTWLVNWYYGGNPPENVWLGTSVEDQEWADKRVPELLKAPARLRWLSVEPQLGPVDLRHIQHNGEVEIDSLTGDHGVIRPLAGRSPNKISWVICGGESGGKARPFDVEWAETLRIQCKATHTPFFMKQLGARPVRDMPGVHRSYKESFGGYPWKLKHPAGADPGEWPERLRVQETPKGA